MIDSVHETTMEKILSNTISFIVVYFIVLLSMNANYIFEFTNSRCVETSKTFEDSIFEAYYEQGSEYISDYILSCPFNDGWEMKVPKEYILTTVEKNKDNYIFKLKLANITDVNWTGGVSNGNRSEILFKNFFLNRYNLENVTTLYSGDVKYRIISIDIDSEWIHVSLDRDASACAYPNVLKAE